MRLMKWIAAVALVAYSSTALSVTNGSLDGNKHPNVGTIVAEYKTPGVKDRACTGTLISETVFLTAGHCLYLLQQVFGVTEVWVTFDPVFSPSATLYPGTMYLNPGFPSKALNGIDPFDIGVIVLEAGVQGITPAALPPLGLLDQMFTNHSLGNTLFTIAGYGATDTIVGGGHPNTSQGEGTRRYATEGFLALESGLVKLNMNETFGYGGGSTGDSGSPNFIGAGSSETNVIAGITILGDPISVEQNIAYRLDTPRARDFLGQFVILP